MAATCPNYYVAFYRWMLDVERTGDYRRIANLSIGFTTNPPGVEWDHTCPWALGGSDALDNLRLIAVEEHTFKTVAERPVIIATIRMFERVVKAGGVALATSFAFNFITAFQRSYRNAYERAYIEAYSEAYRRNWVRGFIDGFAGGAVRALEQQEARLRICA